MSQTLKVLILFLILIALFGCSSGTVTVAQQDIPKVIDKTQKIYHPPLPIPLPMFTCANERNCWKVINVDGVPYKAISHNDSLDFTAWMVKAEAYNEKMKEVVCFYRKDLKEDFCK